MRLPHMMEWRESESLINKIRVENNMTWKELCSKANVFLSDAVSLNNGMQSPKYAVNNGERSNKWKDSAINIALALNCSVEELFPRYACPFGGRDSFENSLEDIFGEPEYCNDVEEIVARREEIEKAINSLDIDCRYKRATILNVCHDATLDEICIPMGISRERVRQMVTKTLRMLKNPARGLSA